MIDNNTGWTRWARFFVVICLGFIVAACGESANQEDEQTVLCGNGELDDGEVCDGEALDGDSCSTLGYASGSLACLSDCLGFDESSCVAEEPCEPQSCEAQGAQCGEVDDGCGQPLDCGGCEGDLTCGGSGEDNICGAECRSGCPQGYECSHEGVCVGGDPTSLVLDVPTSVVTLTTTLNGEPFEDCPPGGEDFYFTNLFTRGWALTSLPCAGESGQLRLPHGPYEVEIKDTVGSYGTDLEFFVAPDWELDGDTQLDIDLKITDVPITATVDGEPMEAGSECEDDELARVIFDNLDGGRTQVRTLNCDGGPAALRLPHGRYAVRVRGLNTANLAPDIDYLAEDEWVHDGQQPLAIDIPTAEVKVHTTHNGQYIRPNVDCDSVGLTRVGLTNLDTDRQGELLLKCSGSAHTFRVPFGRYAVDAIGRHTDEAPRFLPYHASDEWVVEGDQQLDIDIPSTIVAVNVTHNGQPITPSGQCNTYGLTRVLVSNADTGDTNIINQPCDGSSVRVRLPHGRYDIQVAGQFTDDIPLENRFASLVEDNWEADGQDRLDLDIRTSEVSVTAIPTGPAGSNGTCPEGAERRIRFTNLDTNDFHSWRVTCDGQPHPILVPHGRYKIRIDAGDIDYLVADEWVVDGDSQLDDIEIPGTEVTISLTHNGEPLEPGSYCTPSHVGLGIVRLTNVDSDDQREWPMPCDGSSLTLSLPTGTYQAIVHSEFRYVADFFPMMMEYEAVWKLELP